MMRVRDHGTGIPRDAPAHIFEPFFCTDTFDEGTGRVGGVDTSMRIMGEHQCSLRVEIKPGDTCFRPCLPQGQFGNSKFRDQSL
jgi:nitrogen-specific signal transduction histidine kinase